MNDPINDAESAAKGDSEHPKEPEPAPSSMLPITEALPSDKKEHKAAERRHWARQEWANNVTLGISAIALTGAIATTVISLCALNAAIEAANQAKRQADAAYADNRPWVGGPVNIVPKVAHDKIVTFTHVFRNVGHTPTTSLYIDAILVDTNSWPPGTKHMCEIANDVVRRSHPPFASIPGGDWIINLTQMPASQGTRITLNSLKEMITPLIVGCVAYNSPFDKLVHQTGYVAGIKVDLATVSIPFIYSVDAD
jgi:hypothetical protein